MDPFIRTALDRRRARPRDLPPRRQRPAPRHAGTRSASSARTAARSGRRSSRTGTASASSTSAGRTSSRGRGAAATSGWVSPFGGSAKLPWNLEWAAQWSLFGVTIEPMRQGPRDGRRLARPVRRDRPRGVRARAAAQRRRTSSSTSAARKMSTSKGRGAAAHTIAEVVPPEQLRFLFLRPRPNHAIDFDPEGTDAIPRLFDEFDKFAAATAGREVQGELPPGYAARRSAIRCVDPEADVAAEAARVPTAVRASRAARPDPGRRRRRRGSSAEKGSAADRRASARSSTSASVAARAWLETYAPGAGGRRGPATDGSRTAAADSTTASARSSRALAERRVERARRRAATPGRR